MQISKVSGVNRLSKTTSFGEKRGKASLFDYGAHLKEPLNCGEKEGRYTSKIDKSTAPKIYDPKGIFSVEDFSDKKVGEKLCLIPNDPKYSDLRILIKPTTKIESHNHDFDVNFKASPSFKGKVYGSIRKDENGVDYKMKEAYNKFFTTGMYSAVMNKYVDWNKVQSINSDYNFYIPSDGDGTRYKDITRLQGGMTKPASYIPSTLNGQNMQLVQGILTNFARTGKLDPSTGHEFIEVKPAQGSAYAFLEGLKSGKIPTDKPIIFSWGDNFSDIDITKLIKYHEANNSGMTLLTLPTDTERVQSLGAAKVKGNGDFTMTDFYEKPDSKLAKEFIIPNTQDKCLAVVGPYVISAPALRWIKENYTKNPKMFKDEDKGYDFSSKVIGNLLPVINKGLILDNKGNALSMMAYEKPKTDSWSDLGSEKDFSKEMVNVKRGKFDNLPIEMRMSIADNIDSWDNISFSQDARELFEEFKKEYGLHFESAIVYKNK